MRSKRQRKREKIMRGLKIQKTAVLRGYQIYHNYFRPYEGLNVNHPQRNMELLLNDRTNGRL
jgi:hypothetical protein